MDNHSLALAPQEQVSDALRSKEPLSDAASRPLIPVRASESAEKNKQAWANFFSSINPKEHPEHRVSDPRERRDVAGRRHASRPGR